MSAINRQRRVVFVHVPKTAGSSMEAVPWIGDAGHRTAAQLRKRMKPAEWESFFKFAFVRDPIDRFVSAYYHYVRRQPKPNEPKVYERAHRLIQAHHAAAPHGVDRFVRGFDLHWLVTHINHFRPQSYFLDAEIDFIGRFERLDRDWRASCEKAGQPYSSLDHRNAAERDEDASELSEEAVNRLRKLYREDYRRWY